jgi:UDP-N-acetyl-D-mannosaminuronate dehydrogenase
MSYDVAIVGAGYVGLPLSTTFAEAGCTVLLVDVVDAVVEGAQLAPLVEQGQIRATTDDGELKDADAIQIA